jgi:hypothetical protein
VNFLPIRTVHCVLRVQPHLRAPSRLCLGLREGMQMLRYFWDAAVALDPRAASLDEGRRFPSCRPDRLETSGTKLASRT